MGLIVNHTTDQDKALFEANCAIGLPSIMLSNPLAFGKKPNKLIEFFEKLLPD